MLAVTFKFKYKFKRVCNLLIILQNKSFTCVGPNLGGGGSGVTVADRTLMDGTILDQVIRTKT